MCFKIEEDWTTWLATPEVEILHTYARKGQIMTITFSCKKLNELNFLLRGFYIAYIF